MEEGNNPLDGLDGLSKLPEELNPDHLSLQGGLEEAEWTAFWLELWQRPPTAEELAYLREYRFPYLEISDLSASSGALEAGEAKSLQNDWVVWDEGARLLIAPPHLGFGTRQGEDEDEGGGAEGPLQQGIRAVNELMLVASTRWAGIRIVGGSEKLKYAAWMYARDNLLPLEGFSPTRDQRAKRERIEWVREHGVQDLFKVKPKPKI